MTTMFETTAMLETTAMFETTAMLDLSWAVPPGGKVHAIEPGDLQEADAVGSVQTLCGLRLAAEGLEPADRPWGYLCIPCVHGATTDLPGPGHLGTAI